MAWQQPLEEILAIEPTGEDRFRASLDGFGGVTLGCAAVAASRTCKERALSSFHTVFLRPVPTDRPVDLVVERLRDGRRLAHRRVQLRAGDKLCGELVASFAAPGEGPDFGDARLDPATPGPEALPTEEEVAREEGWAFDEPGPLFGPLEWRFVDGVPWRSIGPEEPTLYRAWVRPRTALPHDRALHHGAVAFLSDYHSHMAVARRIALHGPPAGFSSLDQVVWLHRDLPWDDWRLITTECDVASAGRALSRRMLFGRDGRLVASMAQEQLIPRGDSPGPERPPHDQSSASTGKRS